MNTMHLIISGNVQGIGFRKWMQRQAKRLSLVGWVKNRDDGAVESVIQGVPDAVQQLLAYIHQGPPLAHVEDIIIEPVADSFLYNDFIVIQ